MRSGKFVFLVLLMLSLVLTACGNSGAPSSTIDVTFTDFQFNPNQFTVPAGQEITVNATNNGAVVHEFVIMKLGATAGDKFGPEDQVNVFWELQIDPGASKTEKFTAPTEPGEYQVVCGIEGHLSAGMIAKLIVK